MVRRVVWNKKAIIKFEEIIEYLTGEVSEKTAIKFVVKLDAVIEN